MLKIVAIMLNTVSNSRKSSIHTLHTDLKRSTTQSTFKSISAGLTRQTKNEEKDSNSSNASLFTSALFRIQLSSSREQHAQMGVTLVTKFRCALGATVVVFCRLCTNCSDSKLGPRQSRSTLDLSLIFKNPRRSLKIFSMVQPRFCSFFCSRVIHSLLEKSQREQTIIQCQNSLICLHNIQIDISLFEV